MLLQTAAVRRRVGTVFTLVRFLARVRAAVHVELVPSTEALVAQLALERLLTWKKKQKKRLVSVVSDRKVLKEKKNTQREPHVEGIDVPV